MPTLQSINNELFKCSIILYLILFIIEWLLPGFVSLYFNSSVVLIVAILSGCFHVLTLKD
ncbi:MAG: hypothetical protein UT91_C0011G0028 [Parcubacteria group bacterium GW2011_GWA2_40_23]|nr:MAG: hypothetical protein UT91_C0011G0028 [Parcubacteria group bacterium GW2011_GWA2_40_23]